MKAGSASEFGNAWVTGDKECSIDKGLFPCEEDSNEIRAAEDLCYVLINEGNVVRQKTFLFSLAFLTLDCKSGRKRPPVDQSLKNECEEYKFMLDK